LGPLSGARRRAALRSGDQSRYTRCQRQSICLHSSIFNSALQHNWTNRIPER
jgi:hypothetical protein